MRRPSGKGVSPALAGSEASALVLAAFVSCAGSAEPEGIEGVELDIDGADEIDPGELHRVVEGGTRWNAGGNRILERPILMRFGMIQRKAVRFEISYDRTDTYEIGFLHGDVVVGHRTVKVEDNHGTPEGMWRSDYSIPDSARRAGFDRVYIAPPRQGDGEYSIGHFRLIDDVEAYRKNRKQRRHEK